MLNQIFHYSDIVVASIAILLAVVTGYFYVYLNPGVRVLVNLNKSNVKVKAYQKVCDGEDGDLVYYSYYWFSRIVTIFVFIIVYAFARVEMDFIGTFLLVLFPFFAIVHNKVNERRVAREFETLSPNDRVPNVISNPAIFTEYFTNASIAGGFVLIAYLLM
jgi:hypothetical protein